MTKIKQLLSVTSRGTKCDIDLQHPGSRSLYNALEVTYFSIGLVRNRLIDFVLNLSDFYLVCKDLNENRLFYIKL